MFEMLAQAASNACVAFQNRSAPLPAHSGRPCRSRLIKSSLCVFPPHCFLLSGSHCHVRWRSWLYSCRCVTSTVSDSSPVAATTAAGLWLPRRIHAIPAARSPPMTGPDQIDPVAPQRSTQQRWTERARGIHRGSADRSREQARQRDRSGHREGGVVPHQPLVVRRAQDHRHQQRRQHDLDHQRRAVSRPWVRDRRA